jgi:hypothetical protein
LSKIRKAKLCVAKFSYNKNGWNRLTKESETLDGTVDGEGLWYDERILPYVVDEQVRLADGLLFCAELDILPTAVWPLTGLDNYTGPNSGVIPHAKMQLQSYATLNTKRPKMLYTTGAVTMRNYIQRRAGQIADYNHVYGALWVEIADDGTWFVRQLNSDEHGIIYDLDTVYGPTWDRPANEFGRPLINLGDIHIEKNDPVQYDGILSIITRLNPEKVFIHDLLDMQSRNHHNLKDTHFLVEQGTRKVQQDVRQAASFLLAMLNAFRTTTFIVVRSNHDQALLKWVKQGSGFIDPPNIRYWHELNLAALTAIEKRMPFDLFSYALFIAEPDLRAHFNTGRLVLLQEDQSYLDRGIEFGMHGHLGPNGSRPSPKSFRQLGRRANTGHTHSASIYDGVWTAGVSGKLNMGYNKGPSSWSCSHIITYANGKRSMLTQIGDKWRVFDNA